MKMKTVARGIVVGCFFTLCQTGLVAAEDYAHELKDKAMTFNWSIKGDTLAAKISAKTTGWVGIGFNPTQKMKDANYVLGYVKKGKPKITDEFGDRATSHKADEKLGGTSDVTLVGGTEDGGVTTIEFTLPLDSGDAKDGKIHPEGETTVLLAYGSGRDSFRSKHKFRGTYSVNLSTGEWKKK